MKKESALQNAAASGEIGRMADLLRDGADTEERDRYGWTPLMTAVSKDNVESARLLLDNGANLQATSNDGMSALHHAAMYGKLEAVRLLVGLGADVNTYDTYGGSTPLHLAAAHADRNIVIEICGVLMAAGAKVSARTKWNTTPLWSAAVAGRAELVKFFLRQGAELDARDTKGRTAFMFIAKHGFNIEVISLLLARGSDVNAQDNEGCTALMYTALSADRRLTDILLESGAEINLQDRRGKTALMYAAGEAPKMSEIGMLGCEASTVTEGGNAPNWDAGKKAARLAKAYHARAEALRQLLSCGADANQRDKEGRTALDFALENAGVIGDANAEIIGILSEIRATLGGSAFSGEIRPYLEQG
jgi:ankyrin repeat protein